MHDIETAALPCFMTSRKSLIDLGVWHAIVPLVPSHHACGLSPPVLGNGIHQRWGTLFDQRRTGSHAETLNPCAARATPVVTTLVKSEVELKEAGPQSPCLDHLINFIRS
jgi:hypothetical protein